MLNNSQITSLASQIRDDLALALGEEFDCHLDIVVEGAIAKTLGDHLLPMLSDEEEYGEEVQDKTLMYDEDWLD